MKMKKHLNLIVLTAIMIVMACISIIAQDPLPNPVEIIDGVKGATTWADLLGYEAAIYTFLIIVGGWFSAKIPWLNNVENGTFRVLTWAILVISGGAVIGFGNVWAGAIAYFFSTSLYEVILKWIVPSPKVDKG